VIEVGLEGGRHAEVVHRQAQDDHVGLPQLLDQLIGEARHGVLLGRARFGRGQERLEALGGEVGNGLRADVAHDDAAIAVGLAPLGHEFLGEPARLAATREHAGLDLQKRFHRGLHW